MFGFLGKLLGLRKARKPITASLWRKVESGLPFLDFLDPQDRSRLRELARDFLATKEFDGAQGQPLSDEILLGIALQACLPILNIGLDAYRGWIGVILYPGDIIIPRHEVDEDGVVHEYTDEVMGEAWEGGPVLLSGFDGGAGHGANVVIHEFAHKLDMANGAADGFPRLPAHMSRQAWASAFGAAYDELCAAVDAGLPTTIDPYATEHPAEFFAVSSELFFTRPRILIDAFPAVYDQLRSFYGMDPALGEARQGRTRPESER
ncbi:zinc-dependent peptidase [Azoarcus sp. L1K30]|uniref:M90 family metallopeptidase n=1 Tax=Azoarcus sp. L1K30 TaxID=2820277 RepID=UPI001B81AA9F|nr:M90 family metallopeptidase [Azoarcus sp. L1K30]MBR0565269.1 zinc-dependent peptidase [Azoarcus sp. L1K30]